MIKSTIDKILSRFKNSTNLTSIVILVFWAFASRGLGLVRESLVGRLSPIEAEIFNAASVINENIVTLFILGSVGVALLPQIIKLDKEGGNKTNQFISFAMVFFSGFIGLLCLLGIIFSSDLLKIINLDLYNRVAGLGFESNYITLNQVFLVAPILFAIKTVFGVSSMPRSRLRCLLLTGFCPM
jgi:peptidoglycan biosynthesis protein MviN/MurJ (putative lipid II flippase)